MTTDFAYVRWLGNRRGIEKVTTVWDKTVVDRAEDLEHWGHFLTFIVLLVAS